jgi:hypothetical protein
MSKGSTGCCRTDKTRGSTAVEEQTRPETALADVVKTRRKAAQAAVEYCRYIQGQHRLL